MSNPFAASPGFAELQDDTLQVHRDGSTLTFPWPFDASRPPDPSHLQALVKALQPLATRKPWQPRPLLWCALPIRGVALRHLPIPAQAGPERHRLLQLQIEAALPLPPDQLIWNTLESPTPSSPSLPNPLESVNIVALRRSAIEPLARALADAGFVPVFTLACLVRDPTQLPAFSGTRLDVGPRAIERSDWINGSLDRIRWIPSDASSWFANPSPSGLIEWSEPLADQLRESPPSLPLSLSAPPPLDTTDQLLSVSAGFPPELNPDRIRLRPQPSPSATQLSPAILGLRSLMSSPGASPPLRLTLDDSPVQEPATRPTSSSSRTWLLRVAVLALALLAFPYAEAFITRPLLRKRLAALQLDRDRLGEIDRRLEFVQHIADNQPPYFDATFVIANAAPQGTRIDSLSMNRRGEVTFSGAVQSPQQVGNLRTQLIDSKFFSRVVVEEQTQPQPGNPRTTFRLTAQWKAAADRESLQLGPDLTKPPSAPTNGVPAPAVPGSKP